MKRIEKITIDYKRGEIVFFKPFGKIAIYKLTKKRAATLKKCQRYYESPAVMGLSKHAYVLNR